MHSTPNAPATDLAEMIRRLARDRAQHEQEIARIDRVLDEVGRAVAGKAAARSLPISREVSTSIRRRGKFGRTGEQSVIDLLRLEGNPDTARINAHWRSEGRRGAANVLLLRLLKAGLIVREHDDAVRGSRYRLTQAVRSRHGGSESELVA